MDDIQIATHAQATQAEDISCPTNKSRTFSGVEIDLDGRVAARVEDLRIHKSARRARSA